MAGCASRQPATEMRSASHSTGSQLLRLSPSFINCTTAAGWAVGAAPVAASSLAAPTRPSSSRSSSCMTLPSIHRRSASAADQTHLKACRCRLAEPGDGLCPQPGLAARGRRPIPTLASCRPEPRSAPKSSNADDGAIADDAIHHARSIGSSPPTVGGGAVLAGNYISFYCFIK